MKRLRYYIPILILFFTSCKKDLPNGGVPSYLRIDSVIVPVRSGEGSSSENISSLNITVDGDGVGGYELPFVIPILASGKTDMAFSAVIRNNGISSNRVVYPFYGLDTARLNFKENDTISYTPRFPYFPIVEFPLVEDWENGNQIDEVERFKSKNSCFEGTYCGRIRLDETTTFIRAYTPPIDFQAGMAVFLEFDYKNDVPFNVGYSTNASGTKLELGKLGLNVKEEWNKVYVDFSTEISSNGDGEYRFFISAVLPSGRSVAKVHIDNLKIVYLPK